MTKSYGAVSKSDLLRMRPEDLVIVTEAGHELYDERANLPVSDELVASVLAIGVIQAITLRENGRRDDGSLVLEVVAGRQRVRAAVEANRRLKALGKLPLTVPATVRRDTSDEVIAYEVMLAENELRRQDPPSVSAAKAMRMQSAGASVEAVARALGKPVSEVRHLLAMGGLDAKSKQAIDDAVLPLHDAPKLEALSKAERSAAIDEAAASPAAAKKTSAKLRAQADARKAPARSYVRSVRTKAEIEAAIAEAAEDSSAKRVLTWVLGQSETWS